MNWLLLIAPVASALLVDVRTYYRAKKTNPDVTFRWDLFQIRFCEGLLMGLTALGAGKALGG